MTENISQSGILRVGLPIGIWRPFVSRWLRGAAFRLPLLAGQHPRALPGDWEGGDFAGIRPQQLGDSQRRLAARASARMNRAMVRVDLPDWRMPLMVVVDRSPGMLIANSLGSAARVATEMAKVIVTAANLLGDPAGVAVIGDRKKEFQPPRSGAGRACLSFLESQPVHYPEYTRADKSLAALPGRVRQAAGYVVITDGLQPGISKALAGLAARHPVWLVLLQSPLPGPEELKLPWMSSNGPQQGGPMEESGWKRLASMQAELRLRSVDVVRKKGQPVTLLKLVLPSLELLARGRWIHSTASEMVQ